MDFTIRAARLSDFENISKWTRDTFEWGDYIEDRFHDWLDDPNGKLIVCIDGDDIPWAMANAKMLSPTEGWLEGARVHPSHRRLGMGNAMNHAGVEWARRRGARVVRLAIESDNLAAGRQVEKLGYRLGSEWVTGFLDLDPTYRSEAQDGLVEASSVEVDGAWVFWSPSDLGVAGRSMLNEGWQWRQATVGDLKRAAAEARLLQSRHGWVIQRDIAHQFETCWVAVSSDGLPGLLSGLIEQAAGGGHDHMVVKLPAVDWTREALQRSGFHTKGIHVYYLPT